MTKRRKQIFYSKSAKHSRILYEKKIVPSTTTNTKYLEITLTRNIEELHKENLTKVSSICCSVVKSCSTLCDPMDCSTPGSLFFAISRSLWTLMSIGSMMPSSHLILCHPLLLLPSISPSIRVFSNESALRIRWPKYWSLSISPSNEYSGLISFRIDRLDLLAVQGTLKSLLQHHSSSINSSVLSFLHT